MVKKTSAQKSKSVKKDNKVISDKNTVVGVIYRFKLHYLFLLLLLVVVGALFYNLITVTERINDNVVSSVSGESVRLGGYPFLNGNSITIHPSALSYAVYEKDSRVLVFGRNENLRFPPASTAKIMTLLVALEYYPLDMLLVASNPETVAGSTMGLTHGEIISVENLAYGLMLPSGNDAATTLAQNYPGGVEEFVRKMNEKADVLKLSNTNFIDPSGLDDKNYSTALDLTRLAAYAIENPVIRTIVSTKEKTVYDYTFKISHKLKNLNELLAIEGVNGIKTGFTEEAGGVLVTSFQSGGKTYIVAVLKSDDRFEDTREILSNVITNVQLLTY